jgi:hypothetical protein
MSSTPADIKAGGRLAIGTVTLPSTAKRIKGFWGRVAGIPTSGQHQAGTYELEADNMQLKPFQWPLPTSSILTSGAYSNVPSINSCDIPVTAPCTFTGYGTLDMVNTGITLVSFGVVYED